MCSDDETTYAEAKEEFDYYLELYQDCQKDNPTDFRFKYKKGREPDVLAGSATKGLMTYEVAF